MPLNLLEFKLQLVHLCYAHDENLALEPTSVSKVNLELQRIHSRAEVFGECAELLGLFMRKPCDR